MDSSSAHHRVQLYQYFDPGVSTDRAWLYINTPLMDTVGPLIIDSPWAKTRVPTIVHKVLDDPLLVKT